MSSEIAWRAGFFSLAGAAKSGKPCERFTAPCFIASRVISRITDSVNCSALAEIMRREICAIFDSGLLIYLRLASDFERFDSAACRTNGSATWLPTKLIRSKRAPRLVYKSSGTARRCATRFARSRVFPKMEWTRQVPELLHKRVLISRAQFYLHRRCTPLERIPAHRSDSPIP